MKTKTAKNNTELFLYIVDFLVADNKKDIAVNILKDLFEIKGNDDKEI